MDRPVQDRILGLPLVAWISLFAVGVTIFGFVYAVVFANTNTQGPKLPAAPPHAVTITPKYSTTDIIDGNYVLTRGLYRSSDSPVKVIDFYKKLFASHTNQVGTFDEPADSIRPSRAPDALQNMPPQMAVPTAKDPTAAHYLYTEFSQGDTDVAVAVDLRNMRGPTLVYMEVLTQPSGQ